MAILLKEFKDNYKRIIKAWAYFDREDITQADKELHYGEYTKLLNRQGILQQKLNCQGVNVNTER